MSGSSDYTQTPNLGLYMPVYDMDDGNWGFHLNDNAQTLDAAIGALQSTTIGGPYLPLSGGGNVVGNVTVSGTFIANGGVLSLMNATSNFLDFGSAGYGPPSFSPRSAGTKVIIYDGVSSSSTDVAIGMLGTGPWFSGRPTDSFYWYSGTSNTAVLSNLGAFSVAATMQIGGAGGPTWSTGSAVPVATAPAGSLYSRVGGAVGATLYVSRGAGTWAAVAGV